MKIINYNLHYWPKYWENFISYYDRKYNNLGPLPLVWTEFITLKLQRYGLDLNNDNYSYKVTFPSEEVYFLFVMRWS